MQAPESLPKRQQDPAGLDFEGLRSAGIALLQELSGEVWTDYNLHDPGITILEQLCYALTELGYRAAFPAADLLTGPDGRIHYDRQALYLPADILPSQALTLDDYRRLIVDRVPGLDNIWLRTEREPGAPAEGLYWIHVRLRDPLPDPARPDAPRADPVAVLRQVREVFAAHRNLCEDLQAVRVAAQRRYTLRGRVELDGRRPPAETLARVYFQCARHVARGLSFTPHAELLAGGSSLEQIFDGPLTRHGYIDPDHLDQSGDSVTLVDLIGLVGQLDGVRYVDQLNLLDDRGEAVDNVRVDNFLEAVPYLLYPGKEADMGVRLFKDGRHYPVSHQALVLELDRLHAEHQSDRQAAAEPAEVAPPPTGTRRSLGDYFSIQHQFPDMYGINARGIPDSASPARRAQARQLKAYLLLFEQILANGLAGLEQARRLYSLDTSLDRSYFSQPLGADRVPDADQLYHHPPWALGGRLADALATYDDFGDRRNRVLDYLLGLQGEAFSQKALRRFSDYLEDGDEDQELIRNKLKLLEALPELSRHRAGAGNYLDPAREVNSHATLAEKLAVLLAMPHALAGPPTAALSGRGLRLALNVEAVAATHPATHSLEPLTAEADGPRPGINALAAEGDEAELFGRLDWLRAGTLDPATLRQGIHLENYRVAASGDGQEILFRHGADAPWQSLATCADRQEAMDLARRLRDLFIRLNRDSERLLLVEHILLRPRGGKPHAPPVPPDFYPFRLSVLLPDWTARCGDPVFRHLVEETVSLNCPAHVLARVRWLTFDAMAEFEALYEPWWQALGGSQADTRALDQASERLAGFLLALEDEG